jgi:hypothetical protein
MSKSKQASLKLPILLIVGPGLTIVVTLILYAVVNFVLTSFSSTTGDVAGPAVDDQSVFTTIVNVLLFILGAGSFAALIPCLIIGLIMLNKRRNPEEAESVAKNNTRTWKDLE